MPIHSAAAESIGGPEQCQRRTEAADRSQPNRGATSLASASSPAARSETNRPGPRTVPPVLSETPRERHQQASRGLHHDRRARPRDQLLDAQQVDLCALRLRRHQGRGGEPESIRADFVQGLRASALLAQRERVLRPVGLASGLHRLQRQWAQSLASERGADRARDLRLADTGVGAGDEKALHPVASTIDSRTLSTRKSTSAGLIESGGISTTTLPKGRSISSRWRAASATLCPTRSA